MKSLFASLALIPSAFALCLAQPSAWGQTPDVQKSQWNGHEQLTFKVGGRSALLVVPAAPAAGNPWIWRTEFFGIDPQADVALLGKGFHVAYIDVGGMFGAPAALDAMDGFYDHVVKNHGLASKTVLEGFSRGGLYAMNWAARHPDRVACIYLDAAVCDFKSWPGGKGKGKGSPGDWTACLAAYEFPNEAAALAYTGNPVDALEPLAKAGIALVHVVGDADDVVPPAENGLVVAERYGKLGGTIELIHKPGCGHHPHGLDDPAPVVDFIRRHTGPRPAAE